MTSIDLTNLILNGHVLDVGGGGEGIIARQVGNNVISIDLREDELAETPDIGVKIIMDARDLKFPAGYIDNVTCFYSLMYMDTNTVEAFLKEAYRVMKPGAGLFIWDAVIPPAPAGDIFETRLTVKTVSSPEISVGYGIIGAEEQTAPVFCDLCRKASFKLVSTEESHEAFQLQFIK